MQAHDETQTPCGLNQAPDEKYANKPHEEISFDYTELMAILKYDTYDKYVDSPHKAAVIEMEIDRQIDTQIKHKIYKPQGIGNTRFIFVETYEDICLVAERLEREDAIAVDVEFFSFLHYDDVVCLLQISTDSEDIVIDTITLKQHVHLLRDVFLQQKTVKVFHAGDNDIPLLQKQFGLFVVNMFDTQIAYYVLNNKQKHISLKNLVEEYVGVLLEKKYQRANWTKRPLLKAMIDYARNDTHYLLYIKDVLIRDIAKRKSVEMVKSVFVLSSQRTLTIPANTRHLPKSIMDGIPRKMQEELYIWRDDVAYYYDVPISSIMNNLEMKELLRATPMTKHEFEAIFPKIYKRLHQKKQFTGLITIIKE